MTKTMYRPFTQPLADTDPVALSLSRDATRLYLARPEGEGTRLVRIHASSGATLQETMIPLHAVNRVESGPGLGETQLAHVSSAQVYDVHGKKVDGKIVFSLTRSTVFAIGAKRTRVFDLDRTSDQAPRLVVREQRASVRLTTNGLEVATCDPMPAVRRFSLIEREPIMWRPQSTRVGWTADLGLWALRKTTDGSQLAVTGVEDGVEKRTVLNFSAYSALRLDVSKTRLAAVTPEGVMVRIFDAPLGVTESRHRTGPRIPVSMPQMMSESF